MSMEIGRLLAKFPVNDVWVLDVGRMFTCMYVHSIQYTVSYCIQYTIYNIICTYICTSIVYDDMIYD